MAHHEQQPYQRRRGSEPRTPSPLQPELAAFLKDKDFVCLMQATNRGTAFVMKLPNREIQGARGRVPIHLRHELYSQPTAPVIRTVVSIYDQPHHPLRLEMFTNIAEEDQRADFAALERQEQLLLLFYDERLRHRLSKVVPYGGDETVAQIVGEAQRLAAAIPQEQYDFDRAKQRVMEATSL